MNLLLPTIGLIFVVFIVLGVRASRQQRAHALVKANQFLQLAQKRGDQIPQDLRVIRDYLITDPFASPHEREILRSLPRSLKFDSDGQITAA